MLICLTDGETVYNKNEKFHHIDFVDEATDNRENSVAYHTRIATRNNTLYKKPNYKTVCNENLLDRPKSPRTPVMNKKPNQGSILENHILV